MGPQRSACVNVSAANMYREASFCSEICSQAVLWEEVQLLGCRNDFAQIISEDGHRGWVDENQLIAGDSPVSPDLKMVTAKHVPFLDRKAAGSRIIREVVAGGYLKIISEEDNWLKVQFPDGRTGWTDNKDIFSVPAFNRNSITAVAQSYLGIRYSWGGKTPKGLDCSGFVQLIHKLCGLRIQRDAHKQYEEAETVCPKTRLQRARSSSSGPPIPSWRSTRTFPLKG